MLGGFLGAGKTTALLRLARRFIEAGKRVGIITNDQAEGLVDTATFRAAGFLTEEIPNGCFCCNFEDLITAAGNLEDGQRPDVLLAEPVGSCTDLVTAVIDPLKRLYANRFRVAPYVALLDPDRAEQSLAATGPSALSAKVTYIYKMQQNEADIIAINKIDTLSSERLDRLREMVGRNFPKAKVIGVSARGGRGFDELAHLLDGDAVGENRVDVDYDIYGEGEARLGWLNATLRIDANEPFDGDRLLTELADEIRTALTGASAEPAHVKLLLRTGERIGIANVVAGTKPAELSQSIGACLTSGELVVNARAEATPDLLRDQVRNCLDRIAARFEIEVATVTMDVLSPAPPQRPGVSTESGGDARV